MGVSGPAIIILAAISIILYLFLILFSFRKVSGDMVSGGTNSLVLSAACHVPLLARRDKSRPTGPTDSTSRRNAAEHPTGVSASPVSGSRREPLVQSTDVDSEGSRPPENALVVAGPEPSATGGQRQEAEEDGVRLMSGAVTDEVEMALLEEVATSKLRWGAMAGDPGILQGLETDEVVLHLGFGTEDHDVQPPCEGRLYI